jgi:hypothetical protein
MTANDTDFLVDLVVTTEDAKRLELIQDRSQLALAHYAAQASPHQPSRFGRLLLALPVLCGPTAQGLQTMLFHPIIGDVPVEHVITTI